MIAMRSASSTGRLCVGAAVLAYVIAGCGGKETIKEETFQPNTPFSARLSGPGDAVCWSVKRAFLNEGYMLEHAGDSVIMTGTKDFQTDKDTNVTLRLQTTCVDNKDGTSTVFASATREVSKVQNVKQSVAAGVSIATITLPAGSERVLRLARRETVQDPKFYQRFYSLVQTFADEESRSIRHDRS